MGCKFAVTGDLLDCLQHDTAQVHGGRQTKFSVSERFFLRIAAFAQILLAHPLVSSQVAISSSLTLSAIVEPHNSCTSREMASDTAALTERPYITPGAYEPPEGGKERPTARKGI